MDKKAGANTMPMSRIVRYILLGVVLITLLYLMTPMFANPFQEVINLF